MKIGIGSGLAITFGLALFVFATPGMAQGNAQTSSKAKAGSYTPLRKVGTVPADISPDAAEVVWLFHHGSTKAELLHYINVSHANFKLSVDDVNYLKDIGMPTEVVFAMARPPESRENVVRLKERYPKWYAARIHAPKNARPHRALQNHEDVQTRSFESDTRDMEANPVEVQPEVRRESDYPHYYGPVTDPTYGFTADQRRETHVAPVQYNDDSRVLTPRVQQ
jgi:hypothetical protein